MNVRTKKPESFHVVARCCSVAGIALVAVLWVALPSVLPAQEQTVGRKLPERPIELARLLSRAFQEASSRVLPAVVVIRARRQTRVGDTTLAYADVGSGVVVKLAADLPPVVLTNSHVLDGVALDRLELTLLDGTVLHATQLLFDRRSDVGLIKIRETAVPVAPLGNSDQVRVGEWVLAIGSPFGLEGTVTHGIISARGRRSLQLGGHGFAVLNQDYFQTDAPIHPGNSGGPLVNLDGEVIAINAAIASTTNRGMGVGFAIPINLAKFIAVELVRHGRVRRAYLGISLEPALNVAIAQKLGLPKVRGALVGDVFPSTPAAAAKLEPFDVILAIDGTPVEDGDDLRNKISLSPVGKTVELTVWRDRRQIKLRARLAERDEGGSPGAEPVLAARPISGELLRQLGIRAVALDDMFRRKLALPDQAGLVVLRLSPHHPAALSIEPLDVIVAIDGRPIASTTDADRLLSASAQSGSVTLTLIRPGGDKPVRRTVTLER